MPFNLRVASSVMKQSKTLLLTLVFLTWCGLKGAAMAQGVLTLVESPPGGGFFTGSASATLAGTGSANARTWTFDAEGGDFVTIQVLADRAASSPRLRLHNQGGTEIASVNGTQGEALIQNHRIAVPGTYTLRVYSDGQASPFRLRVDLGRGFVLETEANDAAAAATPVTAAEGAGSFTLRTAGTFYYGHGADYFDLGTLDAGNALSGVLTRPASSTLAPGDWRISLFRAGAENAPLVAEASGDAFSATIPESGRYLMRVAPAPELSGRALSFDGTDDGVDLGNPEALWITGDQTIEMWVKPDDFASRRALWVKAQGGEGALAVETDGQVTYNYGVSGTNGGSYQTFSSGFRLKAGEWNHVAVVRRLSSEPRLFWYVNGRLVNEAAAGYPAATAGSLTARIGYGVSNRFKGEIDELRVWSTARTAEEITANLDNTLTGNEAGLAAYYRFEEGSGETLNDSGTNGIHGAIAGEPVWTGTPGTGTFSAARAGLTSTWRVTVNVADGVAPAVVSATPVPAQGHAFFPPEGVIYHPGNMSAYGSRVGETLPVQVTGSTGSGSLWGSEIYTADSQVARAAVHAGLLQPGETGLLAVTMLPGQSAYHGSSRNGLTSASYGSYNLSYSLSPWTGETPALNGVYSALRVTFSEHMSPLSVTEPGGVELRHAGGDGIFDSGDDFVHTLAGNYPGGSTGAVFTVVDGPLQPGPHRLRVNPSVRDRAGNPVTGGDVFFTILPDGKYVLESRDNNTSATAMPLTLARDGVEPRVSRAWVRGYLSESSDQDWFSFEVPSAGGRLVLAADHPGNFSDSALRFSVFRPNSSSEVYNLYTSQGETQAIELDTPGTWFVRVNYYYDWRGEYRFRLSVFDPPVTLEREGNNSIGNANVAVLTPVEGGVGGAVAGYLSASDTAGDYWNLGVAGAGSNIQVDLRLPDGSPLSATMTLFRADGSVAAAGEPGAARLSHTVPGGGDGTYFLRIADAGTTRGLEAEYLLDITVTDGVPPVVTDVSLPAEGSGVYFVNPVFTVHFNEDMLASTVTAASSYELRHAGANGVFGDGDDELYTPAPQNYTVGTVATLWIADGPLQPGDYRFTATTALRDKSGNALAEAFTRRFTVMALPGYVQESRSNDTMATADSLSAGPPGAFDGSFGAPLGSENLNADLMGMKLLDGGDGNRYAVVAKYNTHRLAVLRAEADGSFTPVAEHPCGNNPWDVELIDYDGDGREDVAVSCFGSDVVRLFRHTGGGALEEGPVVSVGDGPVHLVKGRFNNDALPDLAVANYNTGTGGRSVSVLLADGAGGFTESKLTAVGQTARFYALAAGDFNGDGFDDLAAGDYETEGVAVFLNAGAGATPESGLFGAPVFYPLQGTNPSAAAAADFDGDGFLDLVVCPESSSIVNILRGRGDGTFHPFVAVDISDSANMYFAEAPDLNGDGLPDLLVSKYNGLTVRYNLGGGPGVFNFTEAVRHTGAGQTAGAAWADLNGDGRVDLVAASRNNGRLYVWPGNGALPLETDAVDGRLRHASLRGHLTPKASGSDEDWYVFTAEAGDRLLLNVETPGAPNDSGRRYMLFNSQGQEVENYYSASDGSGQWTTVLNQPGRWYLRVLPWYTTTLEYRARLTLVSPPVFVEGEPNNSLTQTNALPFTLDNGVLSATALGVHPAEDHANGDHFHLGNLSVGSIVRAGVAATRLTVDNAPQGTPVADLTPRLELFKMDGSQGQSVAVSDAEGALEFTAGENDAAAYVLRARQPRADLRGTAAQYLLSVAVSDGAAPFITANSLPAEGSTTTFPQPDFTLTFSEEMNPSSVRSPANYELRNAGTDGVFGTADDELYTLAPGNYTGGSRVDIHIVDGPLQPGSYRFTAGTGLLDASLRPMEADHVRNFAVVDLPGFVTESRDNNTIGTADSLSGSPTPGAGFDGSYAARAPLNSGGARPHGVVLADFDNDGDLDIAVSNADSGNVAVFLNDGAGGYGAPALYPVGAEPRFLTRLDFNGDDRPDLAVALAGEDAVALLQGNGDGTFTVLEPLPAGDGPNSVVSADFNGDGRADLLVPHYGTGNNNGRSLGVFLGDGLGGFTPTFVGAGLSPNWRPYHVAVADFDGNGAPDIAAADRSGSEVLIFMGLGDGTFSEPSRIPTGRGNPTGIAAGDLNGDFKADLAVVHESWDQATVLTGNGDGTFQAPAGWPLGDTRATSTLRLADLNADGWPDLLVPRRDALILRRNRATSTPGFHEPVLWPAGGQLIDVAAGDVDGDGARDLVAVSSDQNRIYIYTGQGPLELPADAAVAGLRSGYGRGQRDTNDDVDYFVFSARAGERIVVAAEIVGSPSFSGFLFDLYDHNNTRLLASSVDSNGWAYTQPFTAPYDGRYYLRVGQYYNHTEEYRFRVSVVDARTQIESESNNNVNNATAVAFTTGSGSRSARLFGHVAGNDTSGDYWRLGNLAAGTQIQVTLDRPADSTFLTGTLSLLGPGNTVVASGAPGAASVTHTVAAGEEGVYHIRVSGDAASRGLRATYVLNVSLLDTLPPQITGSSLPPEGGAIQTFIDGFTLSFNEDLLASLVTAAGNYSLREAGPDATHGSSDDVVYTVVPAPYAAGLTASYTIPDGPLPPGDYRLTVSGLRDVYGNVMAVPFVRNFRVLEVPGVTAAAPGNNTPETATPLAQTESPEGLVVSAGRGRLVSSGDVDWWSFEGVAGQRLMFDAELPGADSWINLSWSIRRPDGSTLYQGNLGNDDQGGFAPVTLDATGRHTLRVVQSNTWTEEYRFRLTLHDPEKLTLEAELNNSVAQATPVAFVESGDAPVARVTGTVHNASDLDYFALGEIPAGRTVFLSAVAPPGGTLQPVVALYNAAGSFMGEVNGTPGDGSAQVRVEVPGSYFLLVRAAGGTAGYLGQYVAEARVYETSAVNFPNLQVSSVALPPEQNLQSGSTFTYAFTVVNAGTADIPAGSWSDRLVLSRNQIFGDGDDIEVGVFPRTGPLAGGASYTVTGTATLPPGLAGDFYLIARTDYTDQVEEVVLENDNTLASADTFRVTLAPYADLAVSDLTVGAPAGGVYPLSWTLVNTGSAEAPAGWKERVRVVNLTTNTVVMNELREPGALAGGATLTRQATVAATAAGVYEVQVTADAEDDVFEHDGDSHESAENNTAAASFSILQYWTIMVSTPDAERGTVSGGGTFLDGTQVTVTATPNTAALPWRFVRWATGDGQFVSANPSYTFTASADRNLVAEFALPSWQVVAAVSPAGAGSVSGTGFHTHGATVTLTARPAQGYVFTRWEENGDPAGNTPELSFPVVGPRSFTAIFSETNPSHTVTVATNPEGVGPVTGAGVYANGETASISAPESVERDDTEYVFERWTLNGVVYGAQRAFTKTFSTLDPPALNFTAEYSARQLKPVVTQTTSNHGSPVRAASDVRFTLTFDRAMNTAVAPALSLTGPAGAPAAVVGAGGAWLNDRQYQSGSAAFSAGQDGTWTLNASAAADAAGRVMEPAAVFTFTVDATPPANPAPTLVSTTPSSATVGWSAYAAPDDLNGFRLYLEPANFTSTAGLTPVDGAGQAAREFTFTGLQPDTDYFAAVAAVDAAGNSAPEVTALPVRLDSTVPPPVDFALSAPAPDAARLSWDGYDTTNLIGFQGFRVFVRETPFSDVTGLEPVAELPADARSHEFAGLDRTKVYHVAVVGYNRLNGFNPAVTPKIWADPLSGEITGNLTLGAAAPGAPETVEILQPVVVRPGATLTLPPGTTLKFAQGAGLIVEGALVAEGTPLRPIHLTSILENGGGEAPVPGSWSGLTLVNNTNATRLSHVWIRYGNGLTAQGGTPSLTSIFAVRNAGQGLRATGNANIALSDSYLAHNDRGVTAADAARVTVTGSVLTGNTLKAAEQSGGATLTLAGNWWGATNAAAIAALVSGTVDASGPLTGEPVLAPGFGTAGGVTSTGSRDLELILAAVNATAYRISEDSLFPNVLWKDVFPAGETSLYSVAPLNASWRLSSGAGQKTVYAQFRGVTGQVTAPLPVNVTLITDGPSINAFSLTDGQTINRPVTVTASAASTLGIDTLSLFANDTLLTSVSASGSLSYLWDVRALPSGPYNVRVVARDAAGNESARAVNVTVSPLPPPAPVITSPAANALLAASPVTVAGTAEPGVNVRVIRNGVAQGAPVTVPANGAFSVPGVTLVEGDNELIALAEDAAGSRPSAAVRVTLDSGPPAPVVLEEPPVYDPFRGLVLKWRFDAAGGERPQKFRVFWHNAPFTDAAQASGQSALLETQTHTLTDAPDGDTWIAVVGYDAAGNASALSNVIAYTLDRTPPSFDISYNGRAMPVGPGPLEIVLTASEPLAATPLLTIRPQGAQPVTLALAKASGTTYTGTYNVNNLSARTGPATVTVSGKDLTGNAFTGSPQGPELSFDVTPPNGVLTFDRVPPIQTVSASDPEVPADVTLSFNLTLSEEPMPGTTPQITFTPPIGADVKPELTGSGLNWTGSLTLTAAMGKGMGRFTFSAVDARGNTGASINPSQIEIYNTADPDPPGVPVNLKAVTLAGGRIHISWDPVPGAQSYRIYREPGNTGVTPTVRVAEGVTATEWTDAGVPADGIYRYAVRAFRVSVEGNPSGTLNALSDRTPPPPPLNPAVNVTSRGVEITWTAPSGGETPHHYNVYRNGTKIRTVNTAQPVLDFPPRGVSEYVVVSADQYENEAAAAPVTLEFFTDAVAGLRADVRDGQPTTLQWTFSDPAGAGFNVYRNGVKQTATPLPAAARTFTDSLPRSVQEPVEYRVAAVDAQNREGVARTVVVQPVAWTFLLNPDADGATRPSLTRYFDNYRVRVENHDPARPLNLGGVLVSRTVSGEPVTAFTHQFALTVAAGETEWFDLPVPGPRQSGVAQALEMAVETAPDEGGSAVRYIRSGELTGALEPQLALELSLAEPPLAGGLADVKVRVHNRGYAPADIVLGRANGQEAGELFVQILGENGAEVSRKAFLGIGAPGAVVRPNGDVTVTIAPAASLDVTVEDVLVPAALAETGAARFRAEITRIHTALGTPNERVSGPLVGTLNSAVTETPWYGSVSVPRDIYSGDEPIVISGQAIDRASGGARGGAAMKIGFSARGAVWFQDVEADADGNFSYAYTPFPGFSGELTIWAAHPDVYDVLAQKTVRIYRLYVTPSFGNLRMSKNDHLDFTLGLINPGDLTLSGLDVSVRAFTLGPDGQTEIPEPRITGSWRPGTAPPTGLAATGRVNANLRLTAAEDAPDQANVEIVFNTAEGASAKFTGVVDLLPPVPVLALTSPVQGYVDVTVNRGEIFSRQVTVTNLGTRTLENAELFPPRNIPWMQLNLPLNGNGAVEIGDIPVGGSFTFTLAFVPPPETPLDYFDDQVVIRGTNAEGEFKFNVFALVSSSATGNAVFHVANMLDQDVPNASVRVRNMVTGEEIGPKLTDAAGNVTFEDLTEGSWAWQVSSSGHSTAAGLVEIQADQNVPVEVELQRSLVSVTFQVVPVPFTDRYEIVIEQTFETFVPAPVLVMTPPKYDFGNVQPGFETTVIYELKNHGLIKVSDVEVSGTVRGIFTLEPLINYIPELLPQQTVRIPARVRLSDNIYVAENGGCDDVSGYGGFTPPISGGDGYVFGGPAPTIGNAIGGFCPTPNLADFLNGLAAIASLGANGCYTSQSSGSLGTVLAVALAGAVVYETVTSIPGAGAQGVISIVGQVAQALGACAAAHFGGGGGGGGGGGPGNGGNYGYGAFGCFTADTPVLRADGSLGSIGSLKPGERVRTGADPRETGEIREVYALDSDDVRVLSLSPAAGGEAAPAELRVTGEHMMWKDGAGWTPARELRPGDWLHGPDGGMLEVRSVTPLPGTHRVYTLQMKGNNTFYAGGALVQDLCGGLYLDQKASARLQPAEAAK